MNHEDKQNLELYLQGGQLLEEAIQGMTEDQLNVAPMPGKWSTRQVICHIADFEPVYADRIKRAIVEERPTIFSGDPDLFAQRLFYDKRNLKQELALIKTVREHVGTILMQLPPEDFLREAIHSEAGVLTISTLLKRISGHIPHHLKFIQEKRQALGI